MLSLRRSQRCAAANSGESIAVQVNPNFQKKHMNQKTIAATLVRLFAIGLIIYAFSNAGMAIFFISTGDTELSDLYMLYTGIAVPVIAAGLLWVAPENVAGISVQNVEQNEKETNDSQKIFGIGVGLMGLYLTITAAASTFDGMLRYRQSQRAFGEVVFTSSSTYASLYPEVFLLVVGVALFLGSSGLARIFHSLRTYGVDGPYSREKGFKRTPESSATAKPGNPSDSANEPKR